VSTPAPKSVVEQINREMDETFRRNIAAKKTPSTTAPPVSQAVHERISERVNEKLRAAAAKAKKRKWQTMMSPVTTAVIEAIWTAQNPALVAELRADNLLTARLTEAKETVSMVIGSSIQSGLSPDQAREIALDAVAMMRSTSDDDDDED